MNPKNITVAVLDRNASEGAGLGATLEDFGFRVLPATTEAQVERYAASEALNLVVVGYCAGRTDPVGLIHRVRGLSPDTEFILCAENATVGHAVRTLHAGARDLLTKPVDPLALREAVARALARQEVAAVDPKLRRTLKRRSAPDVFVGTSPRMREVAETVAEVATTNVPVLVSGESGTGKELVARALHDRSLRRSGPFIAVNCAGLTDTLIESELFGHVRGAFTGAIADRPGAFQLAAGGTLFLDEIGDLSMKGQGDLLRVLEDGVYRPVGASKLVRADARIVAASHRDLGQLANEGRFRDDLLYRLNIVELNLPPLRERPEDIPALVETFNAHFAARHGRKPKQFTADFHAALVRHAWPGNIRQLRNLVERLVVTVRSTEIDASYVPESPPRVPPTGREGAPVLFEVHAGDSLPEVESKLVRATLERVTSHRREAARILGLSPRALAYRIKAMRLQAGRTPARPADASPAD